MRLQSYTDSLPGLLKEMFPVMQPRVSGVEEADISFHSSGGSSSCNGSSDHRRHQVSARGDVDAIEFDISALNDFYGSDSAHQQGTTSSLAFDGDIKQLRASLQGIGDSISAIMVEQQPLIQKVGFV